MSTIESLSGEPQLDFTEEQLDATYDWHAIKARESYEAMPNPLYAIKGVVHIVGAALSCFPGVNLVVKVATRAFVSEEAIFKYHLFLQRNEFEKAYYLAHHLEDKRLNELAHVT